MKIREKIEKIVNQITGTDLRLKLKFLKKKTNIDFYPDVFSKTGLKSIYTRLIFFLLMFEKFYKEIRIKYRIIFGAKIDYKKIKLINSLPRSGSTYLKNIIFSEKELSNNSGSGIPKYMTDADRFVFNTLENSNKIPLHLYEVTYENLLKYDYVNYNKDIQTYNYDNVYFPHYPIFKNDLIPNQEKLTQVYLIREPITSCISYLKHTLNLNRFKQLEKKNYNEEYIDKKLKTVCENYKLFINHLFEKRNDENIKIVTYHSLVDNPKLIVGNIFDFFNIKYNEEFLEESIKIHTKDNTKKMLYKNKDFSNRISNYQLDENLELSLKKKIRDLLKDEIIKYEQLINK